nr:uncharacterized protein LOC117279202 [Nicotiana tomentosiformis]
MDNMLCWNVRGMNALNKQKEVKLLCNKEEIGLIGTLETKIKAEKIDQVASKLFGGWGCITNLREHYNGRIWLAWRQEYFKMNLISMNAQVVTCEVTHNSLQATFMMTIVYAFNTKEDRRSLWSYLDVVSRSMGSPWIVMGDFNSVLHIEDGVGGNFITMAEIAEFHQCIEECALVELPTSGSRYTWNDRHGDSRILSKIDWVFINTDWLNSMPIFMAQYLEEGISDHCPLKLSTANTPMRAKAAFKYCNVWATHPNLLDVVKEVKEGWEHEIIGCSMFRVVKKLKLLKQKLKVLNISYFNNIVATADADRLALARVQAELHSNPLGARLQAEELRQFQKFKRPSYLAEVYLQQRSKVTWLKLGMIIIDTSFL